ncbi:hypothetical protein ACL02T_12600 [Pseudonocardia sp. RS010]|uniref:hypothetical protein n=1 Tax=Pseudonocardia sp. RS010 TaxID=3385979 RepID=UPI0039A16A96
MLRHQPDEVRTVLLQTSVLNRMTAELCDAVTGRRDGRSVLEALPDEVVRARPVLGVGYAGALMVGGETRGVEARLRDAERCLAEVGSGPSAQEVVVVDENAFGRVPGAIALYRAGLALLRGDLAGAEAQARTARDLAAPDDTVGRGSAAGILGLAHWTGGDLDEGYRWYAEAATALETAGHRSDVAGCALALADIRLAQGRLDDATTVVERVMRLVGPEGGTPLRGAVDLHVGTATVLLERGDLAGARRHLGTAEDLGDHLGLPQNPYRRRVLAARLREIEGDPEGALGLLEEAERHYVADYFPEVQPIPALRARVQARRGRWTDAPDWAAGLDLSTADEPSYLREVEHLVPARALVARHAADGDDEAFTGAVELLQRLRRRTEEGGRTGSVLAVLVTRALAEQARGAGTRRWRR